MFFLKAKHMCVQIFFVVIKNRYQLFLALQNVSSTAYFFKNFDRRIRKSGFRLCFGYKILLASKLLIHSAIATNTETTIQRFFTEKECKPLKWWRSKIRKSSSQYFYTILLIAILGRFKMAKTDLTWTLWAIKQTEMDWAQRRKLQFGYSNCMHRIWKLIFKYGIEPTWTVYYQLSIRIRIRLFV